MVAALQQAAKVYTVNGAASGSSTSLPDWLRRKRAAKGGKGKRAIVKEQIEGSIDLIQHFEFPEASNKIKTTRDGHHAIATGVYKPQMRVYDLDELTLKFERHADAENVDFVILSDDWTKVMQLQTDRTIELHTQGGLHYKTRIPKPGRALAYHFPSCDAYISASGSEIYRLNLDQGRFLNPIVLDDDAAGGSVRGVNCMDVSRAHGLLAFGTEGYSSSGVGEGGGFVDFWDPRSRARLASLRLPWSSLAPPSSTTHATEPLAVTALSSRSDGLSLAVGTSTGHTLLYDLRSPRAYASKDQGYGLPVKHVSWVEGATGKMAGDGIVISADKKVVKLWDRNTPSVNFASVTPSTDINDVHHLPGTGMLMMANEGIQMTSYYIPQLGPAPRWCTFLDNITEEMEDQNVRSVYDDFKFVERGELDRLGLSDLIGTPALKPYMHGYFMSLKLYDTARVISNPHSYTESRDRVVQDKLAKLADSRIRARKGSVKVKVNKALAERVTRVSEREEKKRGRKGKAVIEGEGGDVDGDVEMEMEMEVDVDQPRRQKKKEKTTVLNDPRFKDLFEDPEFQVDETSREFALLNPAAVGPGAGASSSESAAKRRKTAVEEEEDESDRPSSDGLGSSSSEESEDEKDEESADSSDEGELVSYNPRARDPKPSSSSSSSHPQRKLSSNTPKLVSVTPITSGTSSAANRARDRDAAFGDRNSKSSFTSNGRSKGKERAYNQQASHGQLPGGGMEISWTPTRSGAGDDSLFDDGRGMESNPSRRKDSKGEEGPGRTRLGGKVERFGAGMERGGVPRERDGDEGGRSGRTKRRTGIRSGSRNTFRQL